MTYNLINRIFQWTKQQALNQIQKIYREEGFAVISYVYGAVIIRNKLLQPITSDNVTERHKALFSSSLILPDGAALLTRRKVAHLLGKLSWSSHLTNLNGTDFFVSLLEYYLDMWWVNLVCYWVYDESLGTKKWELINQAGEWLYKNYGIHWNYAQDTHYCNEDMSDWDWDAMQVACNPNYPTLMMVCRGVPRQEIWSYYHRDSFKKYWIIACNQWWTLDYWAGKEPRAPKIMRQLKLESVWRLILNPRKNWSKFWVSFQMMREVILLPFRKL